MYQSTSHCLFNDGNPAQEECVDVTQRRAKCQVRVESKNAKYYSVLKECLSLYWLPSMVDRHIMQYSTQIDVT